MILQLAYCLMLATLSFANALETHGVLAWFNLIVGTFFGIIACIMIWQNVND